MTGTEEGGGDGGSEAGRLRLRAVAGPIEGEVAPPVVRLVREFKGLTVADLLRDELVERLPGQVRTAMQHAARGDWEAAERALPGEFAPVLPGPGHRRRSRAPWVVVLAMLGALLGMMLALWLRG